ncbi:MAG: hypothetical protein ACYCZ2_18715 [Lutibacter sp.]
MKIIKIISISVFTLIISYFAFIAVLVFSPEINNYLNKIPFDSTEWKNWEETEKEPSLRWNMVKNLKSEYKLIGMTKTDIIELLGPPESETKKEIRYYLGMSGHTIDSGSLILTIENGKVSKIRIWHG